MTYFITTFDNELFRYTFGMSERALTFLPMPPNRTDNELVRKMVHLLWKFNIFVTWDFFQPDFYAKIDALTSEDEVVFYIFFPEPLFNLVPRLKKRGVKMSVWLWDALATTPVLRQNIEHVKALDVPVFTFDPVDAQTCGLKWVPQLFCLHKPLLAGLVADNDIQTDCYFLGNLKDEHRQKTLADIKEALVTQGLSCRFIMPDNKTVKYVGYAQNLENVRESRCVVELNVTGQCGLTLRSMESLAFRKKLITNNPYVRTYDFYKPENIFVWGEDDPSELKSFVEEPYHEVAQDVLLRYDVDTWFGRVLE